MLLEIYIIMQILVFVLFFIAFYSRQEIIWVLTLVMTGITMMSSYTVEVLAYNYNTTINAYVLTTNVFYYPYLMGINLIIFALSLIFGIFDIWDKFGINVANKFK